jgi:23S rRNA (guanosine2251-2'-O)-methyltransferase
MLIDSKNSINEALKKKIVKKLIIQEGQNLVSYQIPKDIEIESLNATEFKRKYKDYRSKVLALIDYKSVNFHDLLNKEKHIIILDHIQDPQNFGAIVRAAHQFGFNSIIIAKDRQVEVTNTVVRASVGTIFHMNICTVVNLSRTIDILKKNNYFVYAADVNAKKSIENLKLSDKFVVILGSEGCGIRRNILKKSDETFMIETNGVIDSLNVSQSSAIIFYIFNKILKC